MKNNVKSLGLINLYSKIFILSLLVIFVSSCENNDMMVSENTFENELKMLLLKKDQILLLKWLKKRFSANFYKLFHM